MCALLGVDDTSRLKVVGIYNGSVTIVATIDEPTYTDTSNSTENNNVAIAAEMEELNRLLVSLYEDGTVGENFTDFGEIISLTSAVYDHLDSESETTPVS